MSQKAVRSLAEVSSEGHLVHIDKLFFDPKKDTRRNVGNIPFLAELIIENKFDRGFSIPVKYHKDLDDQGLPCLEIVDGRRRFRAAKLAVEMGRFDGLVWVNAVPPDTKEDDILIKSVTAGQGAQPFDDFEEAAYFKKLRDFDKNKWTFDVIAKRVGKSSQYVRDRVNMLTMPEHVIEMLKEVVDNKLMPVSGAIYMANNVSSVECEKELQRIISAKNEAAPGETVRVTTNEIRKRAGKSQSISVKAFRENMDYALECSEDKTNKNHKLWQFVFRVMEATYSGQVIGEDIEEEALTN